MRPPKTISLLVLLVLLIAPGIPTDSFAADGRPAATSAGPHVLRTISLPGTQPLAIAVYEAGNKLFVADDNSQSLMMIDGSTGQVISSVPIGGAALAIVANQTFGKVYVASDKTGFTTDINDGTGLISVVDAHTGALITQIDPSGKGNADTFSLADDEVHGKVYVAFDHTCSGPCGSGFGVIDVATDGYTSVPVGRDFSERPDIDVNTVTNEILIATNPLYVVDGDTLGVQTVDLGHYVIPLHMTVNDVENKVYFFAVGSDVEADLLILDRDTGSTKWIGPGGQDLEPLVFNPKTNTVFAGAQVGERGAIVDGASDKLTYVNLGGFGMGAGAVRTSTDNAYFVSAEKTHVVNGASRLVDTLATGHPSQGGFIISQIAIDQAKGVIYVVNDDHDGVISVIQDGRIAPLDTSITKSPSGRTRDRTPTFAFTSTRTGSSFKCKLDNGFWNSCSSPKTYGRLGYGAHTFGVRARDGAEVDPTPAQRRFSVIH